MIGHHFSASALSLARENLLSEFNQPRLYCRIGKSRDRRRIELSDDIFWRALGREKAPHGE